MVRNSWLFVALLLVGCSSVNAEKNTPAVTPDNENIEVIGANYVQRSSDKLSFQRFDEDVLALPTKEACFNADKARTNSGIVLRFTTASPSVVLKFAPEPGQNRGADYGAYRNGELVETYSFNTKENADTTMIELQNTEGKAEWEITMPSFANVALIGIELTEGYTLEANKKKKQPVYIALGNSITHGVGQNSATYLTYPFLLSQKLDMELYNLAVGGARVSQPIADMMSDMPQADVITLLIGYNDLHFNNKSVEQFIIDYEQFITTVSKAHPKADIYCISMTHTRSTGNDKTGFTPDDYRKAAKEVIARLQQDNQRIHLVAGEEITSEANLRADRPTDKVHFGIEGASLFADELSKIIGN